MARPRLAGVRAVAPAAPHLPPFAEALRRLGARGCLLAHAAKPRNADRVEARSRG